MNQQKKTATQEYIYRCQQAARKGHVIAQNTLGILYIHGNGVGKNANIAVKWFKMAANMGYASAQYNLAVMYQLGQGVKKNTAESMRWMLESARQGHTTAQEKMGNAYYFGRGVAQDNQKAYEWWFTAQKNGSASVHINLAQLSEQLSDKQVCDIETLIMRVHRQH